MDAPDPAQQDTRLARLLHERGRLPLAPLLELLNEVRGTRAQAGQSLAHALVARRALSQEEAERFLAELGPIAQTHPSLPADAAPPTIEGLRVVGRLGAGGMGEVFEAEDQQTGARVALKTLSAFADPEARLRFEREARAQAAVDRHPNVVRIHRVGLANDRPYLIQDLARGGDLEARLKAGPLPPRQAATIVRDLARGLAHVHACGVLHRDLKPANVLFDERDTPMLVDFGLARLEGEETLTLSGTLLGTPAYMAPEQVEGTRPTPATDVYGLGGVLYHALTGQAPFAGASVFGTLEAVLTQRPTSPTALVPEVPRALANVCLRALSKAPAQRPQSAEAFADELDAALAGHEASTRWLVPLGAATAILCAALLVALPGSPARSPSAAPSPSSEVEPVARRPIPREPETDESLLDPRTRDALARARALMSSRSLTEGRSGPARAAEHYEDALRLAPDLGPAIRLEATLAHLAAATRATLKSGEDQEFIHLKRALTLTPYHPPSATRYAKALLEADRLDDCLSFLDEWSHATQAPLPPEARLHQGKALSRAPTWREAVEALRDHLQRAEEPDAETELYIGRALYNLGEFQEAIAAFDRGYQLRNPKVRWRRDRAAILFGLGRTQEAIEDLTTYARQRRETPAVLLQRGDAFYRLGRLEEAVGDLEAAKRLKSASEGVTTRATRILARIADGEPWEPPPLRLDVAEYLNRQRPKDPLLATAWTPARLEAMEQALARNPTHLGLRSAVAAHALQTAYIRGQLIATPFVLKAARRATELTPWDPDAWLVHAKAARELSIVERAEPARRLALLEESLAAFDRACLPGSGNRHEALAERGYTLLDLKRHAEAEASLRDALTANPKVGKLSRALGRCLLALGNYAEAIEHLERAADNDPQHMDPPLDLARAHAALGDAGKVRACVAQARALSPRSSYVVFVHAKLEKSMGNVEAGLRLLQEALGMPKTGKWAAEAQALSRSWEAELDGE